MGNEWVEVVVVNTLGKEMSSIHVPKGSTLLQAGRSLGVISGRCGGKGLCGTCVAHVVDLGLVQACIYLVKQRTVIRRHPF
jgi:ferredoxin